MNIPVRPLLVALALCAAALTALARSPEPPLARDEISAVALAEWIRARRPGLVVLDTRPDESMALDRLPGARSAAGFDAAQVDTLVLYGNQAVNPALLPRGSSGRVLTLRGGIEAWNQEVLFPVMRSDASQRQLREFESRAQLSRYFGGSPRVLDPGAEARRNRSRRGC